MREFFYGIYDFGNGDFDVRSSGELPIVIFDNEADREKWINCPSELDIVWEKELDRYRKSITAEQARDAMSRFGFGLGCDWIIDALEVNDAETIRKTLGWDSFELPVELEPSDFAHIGIPKPYRDEMLDEFYDD